MKNRVAICECGEPLIPTLAFSGAEYYCLMCGSTYGFLGVETCEEDEELKYKREMYEKIFKLLYKDYIPYGCYKNSCDECKKSNKPHIEHATKKELFKSEMALKILDKIADKEVK